jgi:hypothetical protein
VPTGEGGDAAYGMEVVVRGSWEEERLCLRGRASLEPGGRPRRLRKRGSVSPSAMRCSGVMCSRLCRHASSSDHRVRVTCRRGETCEKGVQSSVRWLNFERHLGPGLSVPHVTDGLGTNAEQFCNEGAFTGDRLGRRSFSR